MAAIDKTYLNNWEQFDAARNWAKETYIPLKNGKKVCMADFMYEPYLEKEDWDKRHDEKIKSITEEYNKNPEEFTRQRKEWYGEDWIFNPEDYFEVVLWNTPAYADVFLIRNCPFDFIQDRLKEQYGGGWSKTALADYNDDNMYEQIKNHTSEYDTYQRNGLGKNAKVKFKKHFYVPRDKKCWWWVDIMERGWWYNEDDNMWYNDLELMPITSSTYTVHGALTKKNMLNLIRRWNLPKGIELRFSCRFNRAYWEFIVKVK